MKISKKSFIRASFVVLIATLIFNAFNFLYHFIAARWLGPEEYSIVASIFSMIYLISIGSATLQNSVTKFTAEFKANKEYDKIAFLFRKGMAKLFLYSLIILLAYLIISPFIANFLKIPILPILILSPFIIFSILIPINRGIFQGLQKFKDLGINMVSEGIIKVILLIVFIYIGLKSNGAILSVVLSSMIVFIIALPYLKFKDKAKRFDTKKLYKFSFVAFIALFLITAIYNIDIFLVKHFFSAEQAGHYAALSLLGKIIFFGATSIGLVMFPKVSEIKIKDKNLTKKVFYKSIIFAAMISTLILIIYALFSDIIMNIIFGEKYVVVSNMLWLFGLYMSFLSLSYICVLNKLAHEKKKFILIIISMIILEILLISLFHDSLQQIIFILIILNILLFISLIKNETFDSNSGA